MKPHILLIDDSESVQAAVASVLSERNYVLTAASSAEEGLSFVERQSWNLILLDYNLPDADGLELLQTIVKRKPDIPVIMVTGSGSERIAVNALKSGASDYMVKSGDFISKLPHVVKDNLDKFEMKRRNRELEEQLRESYTQLKQLNQELGAKVQTRNEELERAYQLSNELMTKAVDSNMQLAELYSEVDESRRKLDSKIRELSLINDVVKVMTETDDVETLLQAALDCIYQQLGVQHCAILLLDEKTQRFRIGVSRGTPDDLLLAAQSLDGEDILQEILRKNTPILIQDVETDARFSGLAQEYPGIECSILVPLCAKNLEMGIFTIYGVESSETLSSDNLDFVSALAEQASIALANVILAEKHIQDAQLEMIRKYSTYLLHDLSTPLEVIRRMADSILRYANGSESEELEARCAAVALDQILRTIQELLNVSIGQRGSLSFQPYSAQALVHEVLEMVKPDLQRQHIDIHTDLQYTNELKIDVERLKQAFFQLAENARHAMPEGGTLTISSRLSGDMVHFDIRDDGRGIPPGLQAQMFAPFVSDGTPDGLGLGLTIVKKIIDEHHGRIEVRSVISQGTTIHVSIPRIQDFWDNGESIV